MAITAKDIAEIVGVSRSAVSAVLNGHYKKVSVEKRERILAVANDLRYRPNPTALSLAGKPTKTIGLIFSPHISAIYAELLERLVFVIRDNNYQYSLVLPTDSADEQTVIHDLVDRGVDGIIISYAINDISKIDCPIPIVCLSPYPGQYEIRVDLQGGFEYAVKHLLDHGHKRIGLVCPNRATVPMQSAGYVTALKLAGIKVKSAWILEVTGNQRLDENISQLLEKEKITAWVVTNDLLATRFMNYLLSRGLSIPQDAALVSFDGNAWSRETTVPLTTLVFPAALIAKNAVETLLKKLKTDNHNHFDQPQLVKPRLCLGGSCGCLIPAKYNLHWTGQPLTLDSALEQGSGFDPEQINFAPL